MINIKLDLCTEPLYFDLRAGVKCECGAKKATYRDNVTSGEGDNGQNGDFDVV